MLHTVTASQCGCSEGERGYDQVHIKYNLAVKDTKVLLHKMLFKGDMFRLFLSHLQAV